MRRFIKFYFLTLAAIGFFSSGGFGEGVISTKIVNNGSDTEKKVFAIIGDGYTAAEQAKFDADVERLVMQGMFGHDFFRDYAAAFNVYRVNIVSNESGVSTPNVRKDTALKIVYSGVWERCWLEESDQTDMRLRQALANLPRYDYALIVANENGFGGCRRSNRLFITSGVDWDVVAHEYGHGIGNLYDEYWVQNGMHPASESINERNCSNVLDKTRVTWKNFLTDTIPIPTIFNNSFPFSTVGMFEGCRYKSQGIYRPSHDCRMKSNTPEFCSVCLSLMKKAVAPFLGQPVALDAAVSAPTKYLNLLVRANRDGQIEVLFSAEATAHVDLKTAAVSSEFLFEVTRNGQTLEVGFLTGDPFEIRAFADPNNNRGEVLAFADTATFTLQIPGLTYEDINTNRIGINIYELRSDVPLEAAVLGSTVQKTVLLDKLKKEKLIENKISLTPKQLKTEINLIQKRSLF